MNYERLVRIVDSVSKVNDGIEQRTRHKAVERLVDVGVSEEDAKGFIDEIYHKIPSLSGRNRKYIDGVIRWYVEGQIDLTDNKDVSRVESFLRAFGPNIASSEYDTSFSLDGEPADFDMLCSLMSLDIDSTYEGIDELKGHDYKVVRIHSFEECKPYAKYAPQWCIFKGEEAFRSYTIDGENKLYLVLRDDYKEVPAKPGINHPRDAYGVSMICVIKNPEDQIVTVTSRWNTDGEADRFLSNEELEDLIGEETFDGLYRINDMARYTFIARGFREGRGKRVSADARTRKDAEDQILEQYPNAKLELVSREASAKGALSKKDKSQKSSNVSKDKGPGKYKISFTVYDEKEVVDSRTTTVQADSEDDAYAKVFSMYEDWRDSHSRVISTHTIYNAERVS